MDLIYPNKLYKILESLLAIVQNLMIFVILIYWLIDVLLNKPQIARCFDY